MRLVIAIDGPAGSGKGTLAKKLAAYYHLPYLDSGLLYRAVAAVLLEADVDLNDANAAAQAAQALEPASLPENLRKVKLGEAASIVSVHPEVRSALLNLQRNFANNTPGAVIDGRDIGTVICPDATAKLFVTASPEVRAARRFAEFKARGQETTFEAVLDTIKKRDERDINRAQAPLRQAEDAWLLDTSNLDIDGAFQAAVSLIDEAVGKKTHMA